MNLETFAQMRGLQAAHTSGNTQFLDHILASEQGDEVRAKFLTKRIQFDTRPELFAELENVCSLLDCSKREFLEMAVCDALKRAVEVFGESYQGATGHDFFDAHTPVKG